jgi:protoporphyrinogen IX oxidase
MGYLWLKAFHIAAVVTWMGGMLAAAVTIAGFGGSGAVAQASDRATILATVRRWDQRVTSPAMLLVWGLGVSLALQSGAFAEPWLMLKLGFVLMLSAVHGVLSGTLRRLTHMGGSPALSILRRSPVAIVASVLVIVVLVVIKPF